MDELERPVNVDILPEPTWASDVAAAMLHATGIKYVTLNPGASYRGFHDSLVNFLGNRARGCARIISTRAKAPQALMQLDDAH
jgi:hypothetical protein